MLRAETHPAIESMSLSRCAPRCTEPVGGIATRPLRHLRSLHCFKHRPGSSCLVSRPSGPGARHSGSRFDADAIIDGGSNALLAAEVPLGRLNRGRARGGTEPAPTRHPQNGRAGHMFCGNAACGITAAPAPACATPLEGNWSRSSFCWGTFRSKRPSDTWGASNAFGAPLTTASALSLEVTFSKRHFRGTDRARVCAGY
jgi:hypothetical protein